MRNLTEVVIHCAATRTDQNFDVEDIRKWHTDPKPQGRGWSDIGYHFYIKLDGTLQVGREVSRSGAHCKGNNANTIGVCFEGGYLPNGVLWDEPMEEQVASYKRLEEYLFRTYNEMEVSPHSKYSSKTCPNFDVKLLK